jgi:hypothetical protein
MVLSVQQVSGRNPDRFGVFSTRGRLTPLVLAAGLGISSVMPAEATPPGIGGKGAVPLRVGSTATRSTALNLKAAYNEALQFVADKTQTAWAGNAMALSRLARVAYLFPGDLTQLEQAGYTQGASGLTASSMTGSPLMHMAMSLSEALSRQGPVVQTLQNRSCRVVQVDFQKYPNLDLALTTYLNSKHSWMGSMGYTMVKSKVASLQQPLAVKKLVMFITVNLPQLEVGALAAMPSRMIYLPGI